MQRTDNNNKYLMMASQYAFTKRTVNSLAVKSVWPKKAA